MDFGIWMNGLREKIRYAFGFTHDQTDEVDAEIVRSISGRLQVGTALDAYHRLTDAEKENYFSIVLKLTEEFTDPQEKQRFQEDFEYTKRKKGQSLKDYAQEVKKDLNRYSDMPDHFNVGQRKVENTAKIREGIRRFRKGIRDRRGKRDKNQIRHMKYYLHSEADLTWDKALDVACRYEMAHDVSSNSSDSSSNDGDDYDGDDNDGASFLEARKKSKSKKKQKKKKKETAEAVTIAALSDRVKKNSDDIEDIKEGQKQLSANLSEWRHETNSTMDEMKFTMDEILQEVRANKISAPIDPAAQFSNTGGASGGDGDLVAAMSRVSFR